MYAIPTDSDPLNLLNVAPQDVLSRAFTLCGLSYTERPERLAPSEVRLLADAARQFMIMGAEWNRPDLG